MFSGDVVHGCFRILRLVRRVVGIDGDGGVCTCAQVCGTSVCCGLVRQTGITTLSGCLSRGSQCGFDWLVPSFACADVQSCTVEADACVDASGENLNVNAQTKAGQIDGVRDISFDYCFRSTSRWGVVADVTAAVGKADIIDAVCAYVSIITLMIGLKRDIILYDLWPNLFRLARSSSVADIATNPGPCQHWLHLTESAAIWLGTRLHQSDVTQALMHCEIEPSIAICVYEDLVTPQSCASYMQSRREWLVAHCNTNEECAERFYVNYTESTFRQAYREWLEAKYPTSISSVDASTFCRDRYIEHDVGDVYNEEWCFECKQVVEVQGHGARCAGRALIPEDLVDSSWVNNSIHVLDVRRVLTASRLSFDDFDRVAAGYTAPRSKMRYLRGVRPNACCQSSSTVDWARKFDEVYNNQFRSKYIEFVVDDLSVLYEIDLDFTIDVTIVGESL